MSGVSGRFGPSAEDILAGGFLSRVGLLSVEDFFGFALKDL